MSATRATAARQAQLDECDETQFAAAALAAADDPIGGGDDEAIVTPLASRPKAAKARILTAQRSAAQPDPRSSPMTIPTSAINRLAIIAAKDSAQRARALEAEAQQLREDAFRSLNYPRPFGLPWGGSDRAISGKVNLATEKLTAEIVLRGANEYGRPEESVLGSPKLSVSVSVGDDSGFRYMATLPAPTDLGIDDVEQRSTTTDGTAAYVLPAERGPEFAAALAAALQRKSITIH